LLSVTVLNYLGSTARHTEARRAVARTGFWLSLFRFQGATRHSPRQKALVPETRDWLPDRGDRHCTRSDLGCQCRLCLDFRARDRVSRAWATAAHTPNRRQDRTDGRPGHHIRNALFYLSDPTRDVLGVERAIPPGSGRSTGFRPLHRVPAAPPGCGWPAPMR
jgi:hypothetical protein